MAYKFRKWRIKWSKEARKFKKIKRSRQKSREAHLRFRRNRGKMRAVLRKTRIKARISRKKNKAMGIYRKLSIARKRWKNILKSDVNLEMYMNNLLNEEETSPEIEIDYTDIKDLKYAMKQIGRNVEFDEKEEKKEFGKFILDALEILDQYEDIEDLESSDKEILGDIISFIEEFGEEADIISQDDEKVEE